MAGRGLGTPATRAQIIENLIGETYILRDGKELIPTAKAFSLITLLRGLGTNELTSPELTGEWEHKLAQMERGALSRSTFMEHIQTMARDMVERAKTRGGHDNITAVVVRVGETSSSELVPRTTEVSLKLDAEALPLRTEAVEKRLDGLGEALRAFSNFII